MTAASTDAVQTSYELAEEFRCGPRTVQKAAARHGIGVNLGGRAGWRFTAADKQALWDAMRTKPSTSTAAPTEPTPIERKRRPRKKAGR